MSVLLLALPLGVFVGVTLGALGAGGSILAVPMLVYVVGQSPRDATTASLVIVGITALAGAVERTRGRRVRWRVGIAFGAVGIVGSVAGTRLNRVMDDDLLLLGFAGLLVATAAISVARQRSRERQEVTPSGLGRLARLGRMEQDPPGRPGESRDPVDPVTPTAAEVRTDTLPSRPDGARRWLVPKLFLAATAVGVLTGLFGVGGGFLIVPVLTLLLSFELPIAVGTSLVVIALNSGTALLARAGSSEFNWNVIVPFTLAAVAGSVAGRRLAHRISAGRQVRVFASLLLAVAVVVVARTVSGYQ